MYSLGEGTFFKDGNGARATFFIGLGPGQYFLCGKNGEGGQKLLHRKLRVFLGGVPVNFGHLL